MRRTSEGHRRIEIDENGRHPLLPNDYLLTSGSLGVGCEAGAGVARRPVKINTHFCCNAKK